MPSSFVDQVIWVGPTQHTAKPFEKILVSETVSGMFRYVNTCSYELEYQNMIYFLIIWLSIWCLYVLFIISMLICVLMGMFKVSVCYVYVCVYKSVQV